LLGPVPSGEVRASVVSENLLEAFGGKRTCFERVIVPGGLNERNFVSDEEYPSKEQAWGILKDDLSVPRDSIKFRTRLAKMLTERTGIVYSNASMPYPAMRRRSLFLLRTGKTRRFPSKTIDQMNAVLFSEADPRYFSHRSVSFDGKNFAEQYAVVCEAAVLLGVYGNNLVNSMFAPPTAVLVEIFPFRYRDNLHKNGGNAGLRYNAFSLTSTGIPGYKWPLQEELGFGKNALQCINENFECMIFYRDHEKCNMNMEDANVAFMDLTRWAYSTMEDAVNEGYKEKRKRTELEKMRQARLASPKS